MAVIGMRPLRIWLALALTLASAVFATALVAAELRFPALTGRIVDDAGIISAEARAKIEAKLAAHEAKTSDQVVIVTLTSLQDTTIEDFGNRLFRHWQLGDKAKNNGLLLLIAPTERKIRIEVGYGLEGAMTDALSRVIISTAIAPRFKAGDFGGGIEAGVDAILATLTGDAEEWQRRAKVRDDQTSDGEIFTTLVIMLIFIFVIVSFLRSLNRGSSGARWHRNRNGNWVVLPGTGAGSGWSSGSSGGGWSSGSSGGGFSGGGGSSGGGGASGDW